MVSSLYITFAFCFLTGLRGGGLKDASKIWGKYELIPCLLSSTVVSCKLLVVALGWQLRRQSWSIGTSSPALRTVASR